MGKTGVNTTLNALPELLKYLSGESRQVSSGHQRQSLASRIESSSSHQLAARPEG